MVEDHVVLPPVDTDVSRRFVGLVGEALSATGLDGSPGEPARYFTDASALVPLLTPSGAPPVPTVILGPGEPDQCHVADEWCSVEQGRPGRRGLRRAAAPVVRPSRRPRECLRAPARLAQAMSSTTSPPPPRPRVSLLVGLLFGLAGMGSSSAAIALPVLADDLGVSTGVSAWAISLYALMLAVATAVYGRVSDLVGIRLPLLVGVGLMTAGALVGSLAPSFPVLLAARIFQGAGAAAVPTLGVAIISFRFRGAVRAGGAGPGRRRRRRGELPRPPGGRQHRGPARLAGGDRPADAGRPARPAAVALRCRPRAAARGWTCSVRSWWPVRRPGSSCSSSPRRPARSSPPWARPCWCSARRPSRCWVRRRPHGFLPLSVIRNPAVVRSALAAAAVPAAWFALLIAVPAVLVGRGWEPWLVGVALLPSAVTGLLAPRIAGPLLTRIGPPLSLALAAVIAAVALAVAALGASLGSAVLLVVAVVAVTLRLRPRAAGPDGRRR